MQIISKVNKNVRLLPSLFSITITLTHFYRYPNPSEPDFLFAEQTHFIPDIWLVQNEVDHISTLKKCISPFPFKHLHDFTAIPLNFGAHSVKPPEALLDSRTGSGIWCFSPEGNFFDGDETSAPARFLRTPLPFQCVMLIVNSPKDNKSQ